MKRTIILVAAFIITTSTAHAQNDRWRKGIVTDEFIFEKAPFPESHAATIAETPNGLIASWFGGTKERNPDVEIWVNRQINNRWSVPVSVANGIQNDTLRYPCWNPVLYQVPGGELLLFYKIGATPAKWQVWIKSSKDNGINWSAARSLPTGFVGPVKNKPVLLKTGTLLSPSSTEGNGWKVHFETSKDFGKTWKMSAPVDKGDNYDAIQPSVLFYKDRMLQLLARSRNRAIMHPGLLTLV